MMDNAMLQNLLMMNEFENNNNFRPQDQQDRSMMQLQNAAGQGSYGSQLNEQQNLRGLQKNNSAMFNQMFSGNYNKFAGLQNLQAQFGNPENGLFQTSTTSFENLGQARNSGLQLNQMQNQKFGSSNFLGAPSQLPHSTSSQNNFNWNLSSNSLTASGISSSSLANLGSMGSLMAGNRMDSLPQRNAQWAPMVAPSAAPLVPSAAGVLAASPQQKADPYSQNGLLGPWSAASAELLGDLMLSQGQGKKPRKKQKDKPKRPLSAYNIFFKEERQRILEDIPDKDLLDAKKPLKRKGKKTPHGKIDFQSLAKVIGKRWQELSESELDVYKGKSEADKLRYKQEMEVYIECTDEKEP